MDVQPVLQTQTNSNTQDLLCSLPSEILNNIFRFLHKESESIQNWLKLRLVNKKLYDLATNELLSSILSICIDELNKLEKVSHTSINF
jgi:hypothetical protein